MHVGRRFISRNACVRIGLRVKSVRGRDSRRAHQHSKYTTTLAVVTGKDGDGISRGCLMKTQYEPVSAAARAANHKAQAVELERSGFPGLAQFHREMAAWLEPPPRLTTREPRRKGGDE